MISPPITAPELDDSSLVTADKSFGRRATERMGAGVPLALAALAFGHMAVDSCTGIWPVYKTLAGLDLARAGLIATLAGVSGNALQLLFGFLADRGLRRIVLTAGICASGAVAAVSLTDNLSVHLPLVMLTFLGSGAFHPAAAGAAATLGGKRKGLFVGLFLAGGYLGYGFSQLAFTALYDIAPRATLAMFVLPLVAGIAVALRPPPIPSSPIRKPGQLIAAIVRELPRLSPLFAVQLLSNVISLAVIFLLPDLLLARGAPSWMVAGGGHAVLVIGGCLALLPSGDLADRFGARRVLLGANILSGLALVGLLLSQTPVIGLALVGAFGLLNGANNVVIVAEGNRRLPDQAAVASALLMGLPWCIASFSPAIAGLLAAPARQGTPGFALGILGLAIPLAAVVALRMPSQDRGSSSSTWR